MRLPKSDSKKLYGSLGQEEHNCHTVMAFLYLSAACSLLANPTIWLCCKAGQIKTSRT